MLYNEIYIFVSEKIKQMGNLKEENVKIHIVLPILNSLGFNKGIFDYEYTRDHKNKIVDMAWIYNKDMIYIEVKRGDKSITKSNVKQLTDYIVSKNISWGLLTNGKRYILINKDIDCIGFGEKISMDRIALDVSYDDKKSKINYLSIENIMDNKSADYFKDIAQFSVYYLAETKNESSWRQYRCTLNNFVEYLIKKYGKYKSLNNISFEDYIDYWMNKIVIDNEIKSLNTFMTQYSHISSMFRTLHENGKITNNNFAYITTKEVEDSYNSLCRIENTNDNIFVLNKKFIEEAINVLNTKRDSNRNIIILLLSVYCGITRSEIESIKWEDVDFKKGTMKLRSRTIPLPKSIIEKLNILSKDYKKKKVKTPNVFYRYYNEKYTAITVCAINYIFDTLKDSFWSKCSLERICSSLILMLYKNGYSIEEISYLTGKKLSILGNSIPYDEMIKGIRLDKPRKERKHPFAEVLGM